MSKLHQDNNLILNINKSPLKRFTTNSSNQNLHYSNSNNRYSSISRNTIMKDNEYEDNLQYLYRNTESDFYDNPSTNESKLP